MECFYEGKTYILHQNIYVLMWNPLVSNIITNPCTFDNLMVLYTGEEIFISSLTYKSTYSGHCPQHTYFIVPLLILIL